MAVKILVTDISADHPSTKASRLKQNLSLRQMTLKEK